MMPTESRGSCLDAHREQGKPPVMPAAYRLGEVLPAIDGVSALDLTDRGAGRAVAGAWHVDCKILLYYHHFSNL